MSSESLARIQRPAEIDAENSPVIANDNERVESPILHPEAANDNKTSQPITTILSEGVPAPTAAEKEKIAALQDKLGMTKREVKLPETSQETAQTLKQIQQLQPEEVHEAVQEIRRETAANPESEPNEQEPNPEPAQAAGGSPRDDGGGEGTGNTGGEGHGEEKKKGKWLDRIKGFGKGFFLFLITSPAWLFALGMSAVMKTTNLILEKTGVSKGGGPAKKAASGGGGSSSGSHH